MCNSRDHVTQTIRCIRDPIPAGAAVSLRSILHLLSAGDVYAHVPDVPLGMYLSINIFDAGNSTLPPPTSAVGPSRRHRTHAAAAAAVPLQSGALLLRL